MLKQNDSGDLIFSFPFFAHKGIVDQLMNKVITALINHFMALIFFYISDNIRKPDWGYRKRLVGLF